MNFTGFIFSGIFVLIDISILLYSSLAFLKARVAATWPITDGEITASTMETDTDSDGDTTYEAKISYKYNIIGASYNSKQVAFGMGGSSNRKLHYEIVNALPVGTKVAVRYNPDKPNEATLAHGNNQSLIFLFIFGAIWTFFSLGFMALMSMSNAGAENLLQTITIYNRP